MADESVDAKSCAKYNVSNHPNECEILLTKNRIKYLQETINSIDTLPRNHEIIIDPKTSTWELICEYHIPYPSLSIKILHIRFSMYSIHFISQNNPFACRMIVGPQWWLMASTLLTLATLSTAVFISTFNRASTQELITGLLLCLTCLISYALVGCFDPGIVERYVSISSKAVYSECRVGILSPKLKKTHSAKNVTRTDRKGTCPHTRGAFFDFFV